VFHHHHLLLLLQLLHGLLVLLLLATQAIKQQQQLTLLLALIICNVVMLQLHKDWDYLVGTSMKEQSEGVKARVFQYQSDAVAARCLGSNNTNF